MSWIGAPILLTIIALAAVLLLTATGAVVLVAAIIVLAIRMRNKDAVPSATAASAAGTSRAVVESAQ